MSRTLKDHKERRSKRRKLCERLHYEGEGDNEELDMCPECNTPTDFQNGFLICTECGWGNYFPANGLREGEEDLEYQSAA
ncbi:MAG: hypothetical protein ACXVB1_17720 [Pseudobdellovibrionaceae bacterium]